MVERELMITNLIASKEDLKNKVVDQSISWKERIQLYSQIQFIMAQIEEMQNPSFDPNPLHR